MTWFTRMRKDGRAGRDADGDGILNEGKDNEGAGDNPLAGKSRDEVGRVWLKMLQTEETPTSRQIADLLSAALEHDVSMSMRSYGKEALKNLNLDGMSSDDMLKITSYDGFMGTRPEQLVHFVTDKSDQQRLADVLLKHPNSYLADDPTFARHFHGPVLDKLADGAPAGSKLARTVAMFSSDYETASKSFIDDWTMSGGGMSYHRAYEAVGESLGGVGLWRGRIKLHREFGEAVEPSRNLRGTIDRIRAETQTFYKNKYATKTNPDPDLSKKEITLYRGVGVVADGYTPAPVESWSAQKSTALRFAKAMNRTSGDRGSVLMAKVKVSDLFMTYESMAGKFPGEENLKGKKEHVVFGGRLANVSVL